MTLLPVLGIDPGADGGAVLLEAGGTEAVNAYRWRKSVHGFNVTTLHGVHKVGTLHDVGRLMSLDVRKNRCWLAVEGLFVPRPPQGRPGQYRTTGDKAGAMARYTGQVRHVLTLAESTALLYGPLLQWSAHMDRPTAGEWRPKILGLPSNVSSKLAEARAIDACTRFKPPLVRGLGDLGKDPHVAEAACIARWGWLSQVSAEQAKKGVRR